MLCRPSKAFRWTKCAASVPFEAQMPPVPDSDEAREGTAAAWVADCVLKGDAATAADMIDRSHLNGWLVTFDMAQYVQKYIDMVRSRGGLTTSEQFTTLSEFISGTLDSSTSLDATGTLYVDDLKYGFRIVEAFENPQLIIYAAAELFRLTMWMKVQKIILGIYQPRAFHPDGIHRTWTLTPAELWAHAERIVTASVECQKPSPLATPGAHCGDCGAASRCVALAHSIYAGYHVVHDHRQRAMTGQELSSELDFIGIMSDLLKARKNAIEAEAETRMKKGEHVPAYFYKPTYGHRKWKFDAGTVHALTGVNPVEKPEMMTPAALERAGADVDVVAQLSFTPVVGHTVKKLTRKQIEKAFSNG